MSFGSIPFFLIIKAKWGRFDSSDGEPTIEVLVDRIAAKQINFTPDHPFVNQQDWFHDVFRSPGDFLYSHDLSAVAYCVDRS